MSQKQAAEVASAGLSTYHAWERYDRVPDAVALAKLYAAGFDVLYIVTGVRNETTLSNEQAQVLAQMATMDARGVAILMNTSQSIADTNPQKAG
ncbi:hypothetical protein [Craterilacuibacter sp. RT1T]|uniref:hypothetical protein n=1 Tax=Craterilacuibacter sp. RT1T TaxID=2942211 RepID=UPI0020BE049A|nr:hypothetical protein [Craterilacuibacter sp. RT1T]MCL6262152.1 hypothetical protein [Craterilacuibacter sp. RT1T]